MPLNFNNTQMENIIFNGTELDKVYMNNVLVFEKSKPIYKRRIMAGDNLRNKTVYQTFPHGYKLNLKRPSTGEISFIVTGANDFYFSKNITVDGHETIIGYSNINNIEDNNGILYQSNSNTENFHDLQFKDSSDIIVTSIVDNSTRFSTPSSDPYRYIYIEDTNIRPIQIGDNLKNATIYLSIPDDAYNYTTEEIGFISATSDGNESDTHVLSFSSSHFTNGDELISYLYIDSAYDDPCKYSYDKETYDIAAGVHPYENYSGINKSVIYLQKDTDIIVSNINKSNYLYPLILVDTTTLG